MGKWSKVQLINAGDFSGYWTGYFYSTEFPNDRPTVGNSKDYVVDGVEAIILRHNIANPRNNNKVQSGFSQLSVYLVKNQNYNGSEVIETKIEKDGTVYQTFAHGYQNGDNTVYPWNGMFGESFDAYNNYLPQNGNFTWNLEDDNGNGVRIDADGNVSPDIMSVKLATPSSGNKNLPLLYIDADATWFESEQRKRDTWLYVVKMLSRYLLYGELGDFREDIIQPNRGCNWKVDLDGSKNPNVLLKWSPQEDIQEYLKDGYYIHLSAGIVKLGGDTVFTDLGILDGTQESYITTYSDILLVAQKNDSIPDFIQKVTNIVYKQDVELRFNLNYPKEGEGITNRENTSICYARFSYEGKPISSGILDGQKNDGSTVTFGDSEDYNQDSKDTGSDGYNEPKDEGENDSNTLTYSEDNSCNIYELTAAQLQQFKTYLWGDNFIQDIKLVNSNPIENIIGIKRYPLQVPYTGSDETVHIGNIDTGVNAKKCARCNTYTFSLGVPKHYNNFLDYSPYTSVTLYLPFVGVVEVDTNRVVGKSVLVKCSVDFVHGSLVYYLYDYKHCLLGQYAGTCSIDSPITGNNAAQVTSAYIMSGGSTAFNLMSGNLIGATMSAISGANVMHHYDTKGSFNSACMSGASGNVVLMVNYPMYQNLKKFNSTKGRKCNLSKKISDLKGFTVFNDSIKLDDVSLTKNEVEKLKELMISGVYI